MWTALFFLPAAAGLIIPGRFLGRTIIGFITLGTIIAVAIFVYFIVANPQPQEGGSMVGGIIFPIIVLFSFGLGMIVAAVKKGIGALLKRSGQNTAEGQERLDDRLANR